MTITKITDQFGALEISEKRSMKEDYAEFVVYTKDVNDWSAIFAKGLGLI